MDSKLELVRAGREDIPVLVGFLGELFRLERDFEPDPARQAAALKLILDNAGHAMVYIIKIDGAPAGMVALHLAISTAEGGWCGRIEDVYLKPEFRRRRIGTRVMEKLRVHPVERGLTRLMLVADKNNERALAFYTACGFREMNLVSFTE